MSEKDPENTEETIIDNKIQSLSDINTATGVQDIKVKSDVKSLQEILNSIDMNSNTDNLTGEQLKELLLNKIRSFDTDQRNKIIKDIANLQQINPTNRSFSSINENKRQILLERLHRRREELKMKRQPRRVIQNIQKDLIQEYCNPENNSEKSRKKK